MTIDNARFSLESRENPSIHTNTMYQIPRRRGTRPEMKIDSKLTSG